MSDKPTIVVQDMFPRGDTRAEIAARYKVWHPEDPTNFAVGATVATAIGMLMLNRTIVDIEYGKPAK